jgi:hypothetical protein
MAVDATTVVTTSNDDAARLARLYAAKAKAELKRADEAFGAPVRIGGAGQMLASVVLVKGSPDADERASRRALTGPVGEAAGKALEALGFEAGDWWAVVSRPSDAPASGRARRLELIVEAVDPKLVVALDDEAAEDLAAAFGLRDLPAGQPVIVRGRTLGAIGGLAASLADPAAKALVWSRFKTVARAFAGVVTRP